MSTDTSAYRAYRAWVTEPLTERPVVSVVVPAFDEEERILPTIGAIATHMSARGEPWELIVADDGSTDSTAALVGDLRFANLRLLVAPVNRGKGDAVRRGVLAARGSLVLFADADQSTPIEQFDRLRARIDEGFDVVVGSRAVSGASVSGKSPVRRLLSAVLHLAVSGLLGVPVSDTQCGFKLFTAEAAQRLFSLQRIDGFSFDLEVLYLAARLGYRTVEVPVEWIDAPGSTVHPARVSLRFLRDLVRLRLDAARGRYPAAHRQDAAPTPTIDTDQGAHP